MSDDINKPIEPSTDGQVIEFGLPIAKMEAGIKIDMIKGLAVAPMQPLVQSNPPTQSNSDSSSQTASNNTSSNSATSNNTNTSGKE